MPGSREWLYQKVTSWLDASLQQQQQPQEQAREPHALASESRMFLLLAGPGMGKSVFSAVVRNKLLARSSAGAGLVVAQHFFKVGQPRAMVKAMVLSLAQQLAERMPGMAQQLLPVVQKHQGGVELSMLDCFEQYLLQPLQSLHSSGQPQPTVLLLIDALDEADDGRGDWVPVAQLIANQ